MKNLIRFILFPVVLAPLGFAAVVASVGPATTYTRSLFFPGSGVYSMGWNQTGTYTNVDIRVDMGEFTSSPTGGTITGYLTSQVGAGTTALLHEIMAPVTVAYAPSHSGLLTIFSGLTLGPGDYFLTVTGDNSVFASIGETFTPTVVLDPGVSLLGFGIDCCTPSSYIPSQVTPWTFSSFAFEVTGVSPVPEPSTLALVGAALVILGRRRTRVQPALRRQRRSRV